MKHKIVEDTELFEISFNFAAEKTCASKKLVQHLSASITHCFLDEMQSLIIY